MTQAQIEKVQDLSHLRPSLLLWRPAQRPSQKLLLRVHSIPVINIGAADIAVQLDLLCYRSAKEFISQQLCYDFQGDLVN